MDDIERMDGGSGEEMDASSRKSGDSEDSGQGNLETLGNQGLASVGQGPSGYQELPSGMSEGTSSTMASTARNSFSSQSEDFQEPSISPEKRRGVKSNEPGPAKKIRAESPGSDSVALRSQHESSGSNDEQSNEGSAIEQSPAVEPLKEQSLDEEVSDEEFSDEEPSNAYVEITKYALNARSLLLTVLEEVMKKRKEMKLYQECRNSFDSLSKSPEVKYYLVEDLYFYAEQLATSWEADNAFFYLDGSDDTMLFRTLKRYNSLAKLVVRTLIHTVSDLQGSITGGIMSKYVRLKKKYCKFARYWRGRDAQNEPSRGTITAVKETTERHLLQTRNAFREFLLHMREFAIEKTLMERYERVVFREDVSFLKRCIE